MRAKKSLGQNFLRDAAVIRHIVDALEVSAGDTIIEIGPGRGALTEVLTETEAEVLAVEIDRELVPLLESKFNRHPRLRVVEADFLEIDIFNQFKLVDATRVKVVGNLPYYISTPIVQRLIEKREHFERAVLMLQREVVDRLVAKPGISDRGYITVLTEIAFETEKLFEVPPQSFQPAPKIHSAVARFTPRPTSNADSPEFRRFLSQAFTQKRKTILNNLKTTIRNAAAVLEQANISPTRRAETLTVAEWNELFITLR